MKPHFLRWWWIALWWCIGLAMLHSLVATAEEPNTTRLQIAPALIFDALSKEYWSAPGELSCQIKFSVTNASSAEVIVRHLITSCGCAAAQMPDAPWKLAPGGSGVITALIDLRGKTGTLNESLQVHSSAGMVDLQMRVIVPETRLDGEASRHRESAAPAESQSSFGRECASCHVTWTARDNRKRVRTSCWLCHNAVFQARSGSGGLASTQAVSAAPGPKQ